MILKICGITREEDVRLAAQAGADYVGAILVETSPRCVSTERATAIFAAARPAKGVLVTRDMPLEQLLRILDEVRPYAVQLHGRESAEYASAIPASVHVWKAFNLNLPITMEEMASFPAELIVADSGGGTGRPCDWTRAAKLATLHPILLAGGLSVNNLREAVAAVRPTGVDVSGGVESSPGIKDPAALSALGNLVQNIQKELER